jgi:hypothetical protein
MKKRLGIFGIILTLATGAAAQVSSLQQKAERALATYFMTYSGKNTDFQTQPRLKKLIVNDRAKTVQVVTDEYFAQQEFTNKQVGKIYKAIKHEHAQNPTTNTRSK